MFFDWTQLSTIDRRVVSNHLFILVETYMNALNFFSYSLNDYSSPLHIQNEASSRTTFGTFFSFDLFQGTAKPQNRGGKVETK